MRRNCVHVLLAVVALLVTACASEAAVKVEKITYLNMPNCYKLSNGTVDVIVTTDIGPRIIAYKLTGGQNVLGELSPDDPGVKSDFGVWRAVGGHRLWHAPEVMPRTYMPDDKPVRIERIADDTIDLIAPDEPATGIRKEMEIKLDSDGSRVTITHRLLNRGIWPVELAPWGLTIMKGGGMEIIPQEPYIPHGEKLLPARTIAIWHYTDLSDSRWTFLKKYVLLRTDPAKAKNPMKLGAANRQGWAAYLVEGQLFVKRFAYVEGANYPDMGCNFETYTDGDFMEIETLAPLVKLEPGEFATHVETWHLFPCEKAPAAGVEAFIDSEVVPLVAKARQ